MSFSFKKHILRPLKKIAASPFETFRDFTRGLRSYGRMVGNLAKGDFGDAWKDFVGGTGQVAKGSLNLSSGGLVSDGGVIDTQVKEELDYVAAPEKKEEASVSFAEAGDPAVILGADEVEENIRKRKKRPQSGFLGGIDGSSGNLLI